MENELDYHEDLLFIQYCYEKQIDEINKELYFLEDTYYLNEINE